MSLLISAACFCDMGRVRNNNEDNFCFAGEYLPQENTGSGDVLLLEEVPIGEGLCFAVFDGMGGEYYGEEAAFLAAKTLNSLLQRKPKQTEDWLTYAALQCNRSVLQAAKGHETSHMGATLAALSLTERGANLANLGDSRIYRIRSGSAEQLSLDHVAYDPAYAGKKAPLTQHLGIDTERIVLEPYVKTVPLAAGDCFLLCSDGITDALTDGDIAEILSGAGGVSEKVQTLISTALDRGSRDNATAIAVTVSDSTAEKPKKEQKQSKKGILFAAIAGLALAGAGIAALLLR